MEENMQMRISTAKACFSRLGGALILIVALTSATQFLVTAVVTVVLMMMERDINSIPWLMWVVTFAPIYVVGFPVGLAVIRKMPKDQSEPVPMGAKQFLSVLLMCFPVMYVGAIVGNLLSQLLSLGRAINTVENLAMDNSLLKILVMVVLAPLFEEYVFRKQIIDRCARYGERTAVVFSGVIFGLFHMNLFQFFYACGLGLIFAYVYLKTRCLRYCVAMHMVVNFMGSVVAPWVVTQVDWDTLSNLSAQTLDEATLSAVAPGVMLYMGYLLFILIAFVVGLVLLILKRKQVKFSPAEEELPKEERMKVVYGNVGVVVFMVICVISAALVLWII